MQQKNDLVDQHLGNISMLDAMPANQAQLLKSNMLPAGKKKLPKLQPPHNYQLFPEAILRQ